MARFITRHGALLADMTNVGSFSFRRVVLVDRVPQETPDHKNHFRYDA
jgi:hypothetical protein